MMKTMLMKTMFSKAAKLITLVAICSVLASCDDPQVYGSVGVSSYGGGGYGRYGGGYYGGSPRVGGRISVGGRIY
jgi:hypothetical protein